MIEYISNMVSNSFPPTLPTLNLFRYAAAMSNDPGKHVTAERDASTSSIEEPSANLLFWELLVRVGGAVVVVVVNYVL